MDFSQFLAGMGGGGGNGGAAKLVFFYERANSTNALISLAII